MRIALNNDYMTYYTLLNGRKINLESLSKQEREHVKNIEKLIADNEDYDDVYRQAFAPLEEGKSFTPQTIVELFNSRVYKITMDLMQQYWAQQYLPKEK